MRFRMSAAPWCVAVALLVGCGDDDLGATTGAEPVAVSATTRGYKVLEVGAGGAGFTTPFAMTLIDETADGGHEVEIVSGEQAAVFTLAPDGRLTKHDPTLPMPPWHPILLPVLPAGDGPLSVGQTWTYTWPDDAYVDTSDALELQERVTYELLSMTGGIAVIRTTADRRVVDNDHWDQALSRFGPTFSTAVSLLATAWRASLEGTVELELGTGQVVAASGKRRIVPMFDPLDVGLADSPAAFDYSITLEVTP